MAPPGRMLVRDGDGSGGNRLGDAPAGRPVRSQCAEAHRRSGARRMLKDEGHALGIERLAVEPGSCLACFEGGAGPGVERIGGVVEVGAVAPGQNRIRPEVLRGLREVGERVRGRLQRHEEVLGHGHDLTQVQPAERP